jgi:hypothetical protein
MIKNIREEVLTGLEIIRGLAFFSSGCNQHKSFHLNNTAKQVKKNGKNNSIIR